MPTNRQQKRTEAELSPSTIEFSGLLDCYNFLLPNEYSDSTFGLLAFLLRNSVGETNFFDVIRTVISRVQYEYYQKNQASTALLDFICEETDKRITQLLETRRSKLSNIPASLEKCMMLDRLISCINENPAHFERRLLEVVNYIKSQMIDSHLNQLIRYPEDFRQREDDFRKRRRVLDMRRLSYCTSTEIVASNLISLQNRTNEHLWYIIDSRMRYDRSFQATGLEEIKRIFGTSVLIIDQPHSGVNPVTVAVVNKDNNCIYDAGIDVTIICLLNDFIQAHPDVITLSDIMPSLSPPSNDYKLVFPEKIGWNLCKLQITPGGQPHTVLCAKISNIKIRLTSSTDKKIHLADLHAFQFSIELNLNLRDQRIQRSFQILVNSPKFMIVTHTDQISHAVAAVVLDDIRQFSQSPKDKVDVICTFILRYFIYRTGVLPKKDLENYVLEQLQKALSARSNCEKLEDIYLDFVFLFVNQIEFMAKHPILSMWYAEGLFLGPCDREKVAASMRRLATVASSIIALRFGSIKVDLTAPKTLDSTKSPKCHIRVDMYNASTDNFQNSTFDSAKLFIDILKFINTASDQKASSIKILSILGDANTLGSYRPYTDFQKYSHEKLFKIHQTDERYDPLVDLFVQIDAQRGNQTRNTTNVQPPANCPQLVFQNFQHLITYLANNPLLLNQIIQECNNMHLSNIPVTSNSVAAPMEDPFAALFNSPLSTNDNYDPLDTTEDRFQDSDENFQ